MLLSVVIPVYHGAITIVRLVETVQEQMRAYAFEIILINDGSKDDSERVCLGLAERFQNITFLSSLIKIISKAYPRSCSCTVSTSRTIVMAP